METENVTGKRIVVITDATLNDNATGMAQTLANLFDDYPESRLLFCTPQKSSGKFKKVKSISYQSRMHTNQLLKKLTPAFFVKQYFENIKLPVIVKNILSFEPEIILISNLDYYPCLITIALLKQRKLSLCVYLMDYISKENKFTFNSFLEPLMLKASKHIFISKYMAEFYLNKYPGIKYWRVVHNPVDQKEIASAPIINKVEKEITFAYAGSLWPMHLDAIILFAKALKVLQAKEMNVQLVIYTALHFYEMNQQIFEELKIIYGGFYRYDLLKPQLVKYRALLVASSFDEKFYGLSAYSIQTKLTDYLACGVPVISIGPTYSACNKFIDENACGFVIETNDVSQIAKQIEAYLEKDTNCLLQKASHGLTLMKEKYKKNKVQHRLYSFLSA